MTEAAAAGQAWDTLVEIYDRFGVNAVNLGYFHDDSLIPTWARSSMQKATLHIFSESGFGMHDAITRNRLTLPRACRYIYGKHYPWPSMTGIEQAAVDLIGSHGYTHAHIHRIKDSSGHGERLVALWTDGRRFPVLDALDIRSSWTLACLLTAFVPPPIPGDDRDLLDLGYEMLSPRETETLTMVARGYRNAEIATRMGIAEVTVRLHLQTARQKMGAATREQAVVLAMCRGLLPL